jgi:probable addiction module antidote protein
MSTKLKTRPFDITEYLDDDEAIAMYLSDIMEEDNPSLLADALGNIARAKGMTQIAKAAGIGRESLYKALKPDAQPRYETVSRVCKALGMKLTAQVA